MKELLSPALPSRQVAGISVINGLMVLALLFLAAGLFTVIIVMTIAVVSQTSIAVASLQLFGHEAPQEQSSGAAGLAKVTLRTISVELL